RSWPILRVADGRRLDLRDFILPLGGGHVVLVGANHDNMRHHRYQLALIRELHEKAKLPFALGLETFEAANQPVLDAWIAGKISLLKFLTLYYRNWGEDWRLYGNIFIYARDNRIALIGLNAPQKVLQKVGQRGFAALDRQDLSQLPAQITCDVDGAYEEFIAKVYDRKDGNNFSFRSFCEAQILWDTVMATNILNYISKHPDRILVVLSGNGHCLKPAIPQQLERRVNVPYSVVLPETWKENRFSTTKKETDYLWLHDFIPEFPTPP
ncbi:MAG: ChaN family lipoprotein, partial [Deltaproteobacteria bacterium]